jgi:hypothetical protein
MGEAGMSRPEAWLGRGVVLEVRSADPPLLHREAKPEEFEVATAEGAYLLLMDLMGV